MLRQLHIPQNVIRKVLNTRLLDRVDIHPPYNSISLIISINVLELPTRKQEFGSLHHESLRYYQTHTFYPNGLRLQDK